MVAVLACISALILCLWAGRRSLGQGLVALYTVGYFYGILRANLPSEASHFVFDAAVLGFYLSQDWSGRADSSRAARTVRLWTLSLVAWPLMLMVLPAQPLLVRLVGLRGAIFFIPILIVGARLRETDLRFTAGGLAILNLAALGFAVAEYVRGVPAFYPYNAVTRIIYLSGDVAGGYFRIPAIFVNAAAYGGNMVASLPYLIGGWQEGERTTLRWLALAGIVSAMVGILMSASRTSFIVGIFVVVVAMFRTRMSAKQRIVFVLVLAGVGFAAVTNTRFGRFKTLSNTDYVQDRIAGSVNRGFFEILAQYPMGNGLGGGGTSMPYFLENQVRNPIGMENEYARILSEQGVIGLCLWVGFLVWFLSRVSIAFATGPWGNARRIAFLVNAFSVSSAFMGLGLLTAIPSTATLLLGIGWTSVPMGPSRKRTIRSALPGWRQRVPAQVAWSPRRRSLSTR